MASEQSTKEFLGWLSRYSPEVYAAVMEEVPEAAVAVSEFPGIAGLGQTMGPPVSLAPAGVPGSAATVPWWQKALNVAGGVAESFFQYKAQKDVLKVQTKRAEQGLPPIPLDAYAPTIRHSVDIPPAFKQAAMGTGTLLALGIGAAALLYFATR